LLNSRRCFLEAARQVSEVDREKGVLILKLWHSYFDQVTFDPLNKN
jgi:hypothetical protein